MNSFSARGITRSRVPFIALLALTATIGLAGCEGDSVRSGGPSGPPDSGGGTGPTGPTGPADVPIVLGGDVKNVGTGAGLSAQQIEDIGRFVATLDSTAVASGKVVIEFTVTTPQGGKVLGLAPTTLRLGIAKLVPAVDALPSRWQSYINRSVNGAVTSPALAAAIQANTETGVAAGWAELGAGKYRYTSAVDLTKVTAPIAVAYEPALTHRASIAIDLSAGASQRALAPDNPFKDFVPAGGTVTTEKRIATTATCAGCHVQFAEHGGPRRTVEYCVVCHNPGSIDPDSGESVDLAYMAHSIHRGADRDTPFVVVGFNSTVYDFSDVAYPQPTSFCETCHTQSAATPQGDDWKTNVGVPACGGCHVAGVNKTGPDPATGRYRYSFTHPTGTLPPDFLTFEDGQCTGCHKPGGSGGGALEVHQRDPDRKQIENGRLFTYKVLKVENAEAGKQPKVTFQILGADGKPIDVKALTTGRLRLDFAWTGKDLHNVADIASGALAAPRGEAIVVDFSSDKSPIVDNKDGTFSYTLSQPLPSGFSNASLGTGLMVVLEGRRELPDGSRAYVPSAYAFAGGPARAELVSRAKCETCHVQVSAHGGSRAGNPLMCVACHQSSAGGTWGSDAIGALALGAFIHKVHKGVEDTYPQSLARCTGCHADEKVYLARESALPLTVDAGTTLEDGPAALSITDDLADAATSGTCKGCHDSSAALDHMRGQGGYFGLPKTLTPSSAVEGCAFCHGPGRTFDVAAAHCSTLPYGQCTD